MSVQDLLPGLEASQNVHPMFVHLPLGLWPVALAFFVVGAARHSERLIEVGRWMLYLATVAAVVAAATGWFAAGGLGHDSPGHDLVHIHRNWMLVATGLSILTSALAFAFRRARGGAKPWLTTAAVVLTFGTAALGADRGAYLVYGKGVGVSRDTAPEQGLEPKPHSGHEHGR